MARYLFPAAALASALLLISSSAQPVPKLNSLSPEWIQRGNSAEISLSGENLAEARDILISGAPGVRTRIIAPKESKVAVESSLGGVSSVTRPDGKNLKVEISIEPDAALAERELRVATATGVSNPLPLRVGHLREIASAEKTKREEAQAIELPAAINGVVKNAADSHFYKFTAKKSEHVILEVNAARAGSPLDSSLAIFDSEGKEIARDEDAVGLDSMIDFTPPADGEYSVELRDFRYQGGGDYKYRLNIGVMPYVASSYPFGGQRGQTVEVSLKGTNLGDTTKLLLELAKDAPTGRQEIRASTPLGLSNPFPLEVSDLPNRSESEPNSALAQADKISLPVAINGRIGAKKDYDAFRFEAAKDQRTIFEVNAFRYGSRLDAVLILADERGNVLQRNDDSAGVDARIDYTFKDGGTHYIILEDLLGRGGDDFPYRLNVSIPQPAFFVVAMPDTPRLRRGGHVPVRCEVNRVNGFSEAVKITCEDLPPGIYAEPLVLPNSTSVGALLLTASAEAPLGAIPLKLIARSTKATRDVQPLFGDRPVKQAFLTVLDEVPFSVAPGILLGSVEQNENLDIQVLVERRNGFAGDIKITPESFTAAREGVGRSFEFQPLTLKSNQISGTLTLRAKTESELGPRVLVLKAEADAGGVTVADYSTPLPLTASEIPFVINPSLKKLLVTALPESASSAASEAVFTAKVNRRLGFAGELELALEGVPEGVKASVGKIPADGSEATIKLVASEKAVTGKDYTLTITATGTHKDRTHRFKATPITLTINAPEKETEPEAKIAAKE
jgi:hypothetical protein